MSALLAVDAGLRTGLALFDRSAQLQWCRSHNMGNPVRLKKAAARILFELPDLEYLVVEGGGQLAEIWENAARKRHVAVRRVQADQWRPAFLLSREMASGQRAKQAACSLVVRIMRQETWTCPTKPGHDASEAVLIGLWTLIELGWREPLKKPM